MARFRVRNRFEPRDFAAVVERERVGVQRVERRRRRARQRHVELLHRGERLAELLAQPCGRRAERRQHLFLAGGFGLLARHDVAGLGVDGLERDDVVAAEARDRAADQRLQLLALRDIARERPRDALVRRALHQPQRVARAIVREDLQERRLFQRDGQRDLQRAVEHRLAGRVLEVGEDDRVLLRQRPVRRDEVRRERSARRAMPASAAATAATAAPTHPARADLASTSAPIRGSARRHLERRRRALARVPARAPA